MNAPLFPPPLTPLSELDGELRESGRAVLGAPGVAAMAGVTPGELEALRGYWGDLPPDRFLRDGGRYRRRRHGSFVIEGARLTQVPRRPHWQPVEYNALHGGIERDFEPIEASMIELPAWSRLLLSLGERASALRGEQPWYTEAHLFRIDTSDGIGRPTPEGAHRDGVDLVAVVLVERVSIKGGETRVFDVAGPQGLRFTLVEPFCALLLDDERVIHETTPIQPAEAGQAGHRDTLVVTLRRKRFLGP